MIKILKDIIAKENIKNPFTDEKIAQMMSLRREQVIKLRLEAGIHNSRERRRAVILSEGANIILSNPKISDRKFTIMLHQRGYMISRYTAVELRKQIEVEISQGKWSELSRTDFVPVPNELFTPKNTEQTMTIEDAAFSNIIGYNNGLKIQINQAKAAILYPPNGLNTLLIGPSGVGKSYLAESMYKFAVKINALSKDAAFVIFNCADYADNPQLLLSQLFGYSKGAFSGAVTSKTGLVEKANQGILFLDEVHRLPSEGQEILFSILDKGEFRRLGETTITKVNIRIIAATTENLESTLLLTFRRRIPMIIDIPALSERPVSERFAIIKKFFKNEALQIHRTIKIEPDVIKFLLLYECRGNVGQLLSDIRVACANGFLNCISASSENMIISTSDLLKYVNFTITKKDNDFIRYVSTPMLVHGNITSGMMEDEEDTVDWSFENIYINIEDSFEKLRNKGVDEKEINKIVQNELNQEMNKYLKHQDELNRVALQLESLVDRNITILVKEAVQLARTYIPQLEERIYYFLSIHLSTAIDRMKKGSYKYASVNIKNIMEHYQKEYTVAEIMMRTIEQVLKIHFPKEEIAMIAMYLQTFSCQNEDYAGRIKILVLTHGRAATALAETGNKLLNVDYAFGIDMDFNESSEQVLERTIRIVKDLDEGKGCLLLVDMGSLVTFGDKITERTGIKTQSIGRVDTIMLLEAIRKVTLPEMTVDTLVEELEHEKYWQGFDKVDAMDEYEKKNAVIMLCLTGEGTAQTMKTYIQQVMDNIKAKTELFTVGFLDQQKMKEKIRFIMQKYHVLAIVGTINPKIETIPFISVEAILNGEGLKKLRALLTGMPLDDVIHDEVIVCRLELSDKTQIIDRLAAMLVDYGAVTESFVLSVYKRENLGPTYVEGEIGVPHGDAAYVTKSAIAVASLERPVEWTEGFVVELVFMFALKEDAGDCVDDFYHIISDESIVNALKNATTKKQMKHILLNRQI